MCQYNVRQPLPMRRKCISQKIKIGGQTVHYSIGLYEDGSPGELFIEVSKAGSALRQWCGDMARTFSVALQHGTPLETIVGLFIGTRCDPCGEVKGHPRITQATSIMDAIARDFSLTFLQREDAADVVSESTMLVESNRGRRKVMDNGGRHQVTGDGESGDKTCCDCEAIGEKCIKCVEQDTPEIEV